MPMKDKRAYDKARAESGLARARRHGLTVERLNELISGGCAAIGLSRCDGPLQIDHSHNCCDTAGRSCGKCVRGVLCRRHNIQLAHIEYSVMFTVWAITEWTKMLVFQNLIQDGLSQAASRRTK